MPKENQQNLGIRTIESDVEKLKAIFDVGRESFAACEGEIRALFEKGEY